MPHSVHSNCWSFQDSIMFLLSNLPPNVLELFLAVAWTIWFNRNRVVHDEMRSSPSQVWQMAVHLFEDNKAAASSDSCYPSPPHLLGWSPPPPGVFKINVDGAASELEDSSGIGIIIRDCNGQTVAACCKSFDSLLPAELVEVLAVEHGLLLARELKLSRILVESDALAVINAINDSSFGAYFGHIIQDISLAQSSFDFCSFKHLNRSFNLAAHELAQLARRNGFANLWKGVTPPFLVPVVQSDLLHFSA